MKRQLYLVDASIYIFQAHFSSRMVIWSRRAEDRSAFAGFARFLLRLLQRIRHQEGVSVAVAFDESLFTGFRHRLYQEYKSNRVLPDENLARQLAACSRLCAGLGVKAFASREYEADDIIGTLAAKARQSGVERGVEAKTEARAETKTKTKTETTAETEIIVVTRDKDLSQVLHSDNDHLWDFQTGERRFRQDIVTKYGIWPEQFPCFLGLAGDSSDCIPGVPGVGSVSAARLLQHFEDMDQLYARIAEVASLPIRGARRCAERLAEHEQIARLSRTLATLVRCEDPSETFVAADMASLGIGAADQASCQAIFSDMALTDDEIRRLSSMMESLANYPRAEAVSA